MKDVLRPLKSITQRLQNEPLMHTSRHAGICTGVKVLLLLHIFQSSNYKAHIFIQPNKTDEISSHLLRSTKWFCLLFTSNIVKISVFNSNFQLCASKYPSPSSSFTWCLCAPAPTVLVRHHPSLPLAEDTQPSHWLRVKCHTKVCVTCILSFAWLLQSDLPHREWYQYLHLGLHRESFFFSPYSTSWPAVLFLQNASICIFRLWSIEFVLLLEEGSSPFDRASWKVMSWLFKIMKFSPIALSRYLQLLRVSFCFVTSWHLADFSRSCITLCQRLRTWGSRLALESAIWENQIYKSNCVDTFFILRKSTSEYWEYLLGAFWIFFKKASKQMGFYWWLICSILTTKRKWRILRKDAFRLVWCWSVKLDINGNMSEVLNRH